MLTSSKMFKIQLLFAFLIFVTTTRSGGVQDNANRDPRLTIINIYSGLEDVNDLNKSPKHHSYMAMNPSENRPITAMPEELVNNNQDDADIQIVPRESYSSTSKPGNPNKMKPFHSNNNMHKTAKSSRNKPNNDKLLVMKEFIADKYGLFNRTYYNWNTLRKVINMIHDVTS